MSERSSADRRVSSLPLRLKLEPEDGGPAHERVLRSPFRLGFGPECDIQLGGEQGPEVVFQVERARGPLLIASALPPEEYDHFVELKIDGEPLRQPVKELHPGTRLDIFDKSTKRRYSVVVDAAAQRWLRPRNLAIVMSVLVVIGSGFAAYMYWSLRGTQSEIARTSERVQQAEAALERTANELLASVARMGSTDAELAAAIRELSALQHGAARDIREEFARRIADLDAQTREAMEQAQQADVEQARELTAEAQARLDALREEFSTRMVESYQKLKEVEQALLSTMAQRFAERRPTQARLKDVLQTSRSSVLFVQTRYRVHFAAEDKPRELSGFGTGFLVGPNGLAVSAQHVMFPWRHDRDLLVLEQLGVVKVMPESVRWSVWTAGKQVLRDSSDPTSFNTEQAFQSDQAERGLRMLAHPAPVLTPMMVPSPIGVVEVPVPTPGASDVAVFQLMQFEPKLPYLSLPQEPADVDSLDEVLLIGYPYSRLDDGKAWPQGVRGFVRRVVGDLLEIDAAVHPGLSGAPMLNAAGEVLGMVSAVIGSDVYGVAVRAEDIHAALAKAREHVRREERRLAGIGCNPGAVDGVFDQHTHEAYRCESRAGVRSNAPD